MTTSTTLRKLADSIGFSIGACVDMTPLREEPQYHDTLTREFNTVVAENIFKPAYVWAAPDRYDFSQTDELAKFARDNAITLRGHTLLWHKSVPKWLEEGNYSPGKVRDMLRAYTTAMVTRYKGVIPVWDVLNEVISETDDSQLRQDSFWNQTLGEDYIPQMFEWAHAADPNCRLYYNDYEAEDMNAKSDRVFKLVSGLKSRGVPINGLGLQGHLINGFRTTEDHKTNVRRINTLGLEWQYTEVDLRMMLDGNPPSEEQLEVQADGYRDVIQLCMNEPGCTGFLVWGFTDKYSWIPDFRKGQGAALPFDDDYRQKPAYYALAAELGAKALK